MAAIARVRRLVPALLLVLAGAGCTPAPGHVDAPVRIPPSGVVDSTAGSSTAMSSSALGANAGSASPYSAPSHWSTTDLATTLSSPELSPTATSFTPLSTTAGLSGALGTSSGGDHTSGPPAPGTIRATPVPSTAPSGSELPDVGVAGVNLADCASPYRPVVLLHGSFSTVASNFSALVPALVRSGRCVYGFDYGNGGIAAVTTSAAQLADLVGVVRQRTGASRIDVIGYSQGGLVLRTGLRLDGLADQVATAVLLAPSWNGTTSRLAGSLPAVLCRACADQVAGSPLLRELGAGGDLDGAVRYAEISTRADTVVTPVSSQVPSGPPDRVRSLVVEDRCPQLHTDHVHLPAVAGVVNWVVAALDTEGRPGPDALTC